MGMPESGRCGRRDDGGINGEVGMGGCGSRRQRAEVGHLIGKSEWERRCGQRRIGMASGGGGTRERTQRSEKWEIRGLRR